MKFPADRIFNHNIGADGTNSNIIPFLIVFLLPMPAVSQPPPATDSSTPNRRTAADLSPSVGILLIGVIAVLVLTSILSFYFRHCTRYSGSLSGGGLVVALPSQYRSEERGLDAAVINGFPTLDYSTVKALKIGNGAAECAVCLSVFRDDETLRLMPHCDHFFHSSCIDTWLASHATCPVCRASLVAPRSNDSIEDSNVDQVRGSDPVQDDR